MKVCFISHHYASPTVFLEQIRKMTPARSGKWKDMEAITDPMNADFCAVFDGSNVPVPADRTLYFGEHPDISAPYTEWKDKKALAKFPLKEHLNPGEWWLDYDYDYLMNLKPPEKTKDLICCFTGHQMRIPPPHKFPDTYLKRRAWMNNFCQHAPVDIYGRPAANFKGISPMTAQYKGVLGNVNPNGQLGEHTTGKEIFLDYKYSIEFDQGPTTNYISERFYDAMFCWTMPFYFGSTNVHEYLPERSFHYIDLNHPDASGTLEIIESNNYEDNLDALTEARWRLLNRYQMFPYVYDKIKELI